MNMCSYVYVFIISIFPAFVNAFEKKKSALPIFFFLKANIPF